MNLPFCAFACKFILACSGTDKAFESCHIMISNMKRSIFITHFSLKVQSGKKLFCLLEQHTTFGRLQDTQCRVDVLYSVDVLSHSWGKDVLLMVSYEKQRRML